MPRGPGHRGPVTPDATPRPDARRPDTPVKSDNAMRIREHDGFAHGLRPGTDADLGCYACQAEAAAGTPPRITGSDEAGPVMTVGSLADVNALRARFAELV